ncbi:MAG: cation-translocating P-type ATPase [Planctomycetes bacterium]|nr:cation-translocating P-type ATPase [Planctomycetota bacterium]
MDSGVDSQPDAPAPSSAAFAEPLRCAHCALPMGPSGKRHAAGARVFCCMGCRLASTVAGGEDGPRQFLEARLLLSAFLAMGVMTFSLVLYGEGLSPDGADPGLAAVRNMGRMMLALFALPVLVLLGVPVVQGAWADLRDARIRLDGLMVVAVFAAFGLSLHSTWTGTGEVYYETATMVLVLVTFGRRLEAHAKSRGRDAASLLAGVLPSVAHRVDAEGAEDDVEPGALCAGDLVRVRPGESVPADVLVERGEGEADCAHVTGEHAPLRATAGVELPAGAVVAAAALDARVLRPAGASHLARLVELFDRPVQETRAMRTADRWAGALAALAATLAVVGGLRSGMQSGVDAGLRTALSVLLVSCPCALGLATPLAYRAMRAALARHGVLVHDASQLERAAKVTAIGLDKTGTLTAPGALDLLWTASPAAAETLRALVRHSGHALAAAVGDGPAPAGDLQLVPGCGVLARDGARTSRAGRPGWIDESGARWPDAARARRAEASGSLIALEQDGVVCALAAVRHRVRPGVERALARLRARGLELLVLSGDGESSTRAACEPLELPWRAGLLPEDKLAVIEGLQREGRVVLFAGDGLNDAPALGAADVGLAMGSGTAAARIRAGVVVPGDDLSALPMLLDAARALSRAVRRNLAWAALYNGVALTLAVLGRLHPIAAAAAMIVSSVAVSVSSHKLLEWQPDASARPLATAAPASRPAPVSSPATDVDAAPATDAAPTPTCTERERALLGRTGA